MAFLVADEDRGRGLGSLLLEHLAALGRRHGVSRFEAEVLGDNYGMLGVFRAAGFGATRRTVAGEVEVELRTDASREAVEAADRREWRAAARSLRPLLHPTSVAVVGVRRSAGGFGHGVLEAIRLVVGEQLWPHATVASYVLAVEHGPAGHDVSPRVGCGGR